MTLDAVRPYDTRPPELAAELRVALDRTVRRMRRERPIDALSPSQFAVLATLDAIGDLSPRQLADREHVQPPSMTRTVNGLLALGLVVKQEDPRDGRRVRVVITDAGRAEVYQMRQREDAWLATRLAGLDNAEREVIADAIALLREIAET